MNCFPLIILLPPELVHEIFQFIYRENAVNQIINKFRDIKLKQNYISDIITSTLYNGDFYNKKVQLLLLPDTINKLEFIVNNRFPVYTYPRLFWLHLLSEMSYVLMHMHNQICMYNKNNYSNCYYQNLKKTISLWFKLGQNHNIKLKVYYRDLKFRKVNQSHEIWARQFKKMNNFHRFLHTPLVLDNEDNNISDNRIISKNILESYLEI